MAPTRKYQIETIEVDGKKVTKTLCPFCNAKLSCTQAMNTHVKTFHKTEIVAKPCEASNENKDNQVISIPDTTPLREARMIAQSQSVSRKEFDELKAQNQFIIQQNHTIIEMLKNLANGNMCVQVAKEEKTKEQKKADNLDKVVAKLREQVQITVPSDANDKTKTIKERYEKARENYLNHPYCVMVDVDGDKLPCWRCPTCKEEYTTSPRYLINHLNNTNRHKKACRNPNEAVLLTEVVDRYEYYAKEYKKLDGKEEVIAETNEVEQQIQDVVEVSHEDVQQEEQELVKAVVQDIMNNVIDKAEEPQEDLTEEQCMQVNQVIDELVQVIDNGADLVAEVKEFISMRMDNDKNDVEVMVTPVQDKIETVDDNVAKPCEESLYDISQEEQVMQDMQRINELGNTIQKYVDLKDEVSKIENTCDIDSDEGKFDKFLLDCCRTLYDGGFVKAFHSLIDSSKWHIKPSDKTVTVTEKEEVLIPLKDKDGKIIVDESGREMYETYKSGEKKGQYKTKIDKVTKVQTIKGYKVFDVKRHAKKKPCKHCTKGNLCESCLYEPISLVDIKGSNEVYHVFSTLCKLWNDYNHSYDFDLNDIDMFKDGVGEYFHECDWFSHHVSPIIMNEESIKDFFAKIL